MPRFFPEANEWRVEIEAYGDSWSTNERVHSLVRSSGSSYMTNGLLIYGYIFAHFLVYQKALPHIRLSNRYHLNFLIYEDSFSFLLAQYKIFFLTGHYLFHFICPHRPVTSAGSRARSPVFYTICLWLRTCTLSLSLSEQLNRVLSVPSTIWSLKNRPTNWGFVRGVQRMYILKKDSFFFSLPETKLHGCRVTRYAFFSVNSTHKFLFLQTTNITKQIHHKFQHVMIIMKLNRAFSYIND